MGERQSHRLRGADVEGAHPVKALGALALLWLLLLGASAHADAVDALKPWFVRVVAIESGETARGLIKDGKCGSGLVLRDEHGRAWLLTARHVLRDDPQELWIKFARGHVVQLPFTQGLDDLGIAIVDDVTSEDTVLLPLGTLATLPDSDSASFVWIEDSYLGGDFKVLALPPQNRLACGDSAPSKGMSVGVSAPKVDAHGQHYVEVGLVEGSGASGSPVFTSSHGGVAGVYVGARDNVAPRVLWLGSPAMGRIRDVARSAGIPALAFKGSAGSHWTIAASVLFATVYATDQQDALRWEIDPALSFRWAFPFAKRRRFDAYEVGFDLGFRMAETQLRYRLTGPRGVILEENFSPYRAFVLPVSFGFVGRYGSRWGLAATLGPIFECAFKTCAAPLLGTSKVGATFGLRSKFRLGGWWSDMGPTVGARVDLVPNRLFGYDNVIDDPRKEHPGVLPRYVLEFGVQLGGVVKRRML